MPSIKLAMLPDRNPVRLTISVTPALAEELAAYATFYRTAYGREESISDLVPAMLSAFIESDRAFARSRAAG